MAELTEQVDQLLRKASGDPERVLLSFGESRLMDQVADLVRQNLGPEDYAEFLKDFKARIAQMQPVDTEESLDNLHATVANCSICPKAVDPSVPLWNRRNPEVLIVSKLPITKDEGARFLVSCMKEANLGSDIVGATSVARCTPVEDKHEKDVYGTCATNYLYKEIALMNPTVIVALGSVPFFALFGRKEPVNEVVGNVHYLGPYTVFPTFDPSYALRSGRRKDDFAGHFQSVQNLLRR